MVAADVPWPLGADRLPDWHAIVTEHGPVVWRAVYRLLGDQDAAQDCYQEAFLAAMRVAEAGEVDNWQAMLRTLATHKAIDALRLRSRFRARLADQTDPDRLPAGNPSGMGDDAEARELREAVRALLAQMTSRQAEAFALRHFEQMDDQQIADRLGTSARNVSVLVHRAAAKLREGLPASVQADAVSGAPR